jgi:hypothetical protein
MKYLLVILALLLPELANAGTIALTLTTTAPVCAAGCTKTYTDTDANLAKIISAYAPLCMAQNLVQGADPTVPPVATACAPGKTLTFWFDGLMAGTAANVTNFLRQQQVQGLTPIVPINPQ